MPCSKCQNFLVDFLSSSQYGIYAKGRDAGYVVYGTVAETAPTYIKATQVLSLATGSIRK